MPNDDPCGEPQHLPVNMFEASDAVVVITPMPAVMADDIQITVDGRTLTITADCRTEPPKDYLLHEWHYGPYERMVTVPPGFGGPASATFGNGQLAIRIQRGDGREGKVVVQPSTAGA